MDKNPPFNPRLKGSIERAHREIEKTMWAMSSAGIAAMVGRPGMGKAKYQKLRSK